MTPQKIIIPPKNPIIRKPAETNLENNLKSLIEEKNSKGLIDDKFDRNLKGLIEEKNEKNIKNAFDEKNEKNFKSLPDDKIENILKNEENSAKNIVGESKISFNEEKMEEEQPTQFLEQKAMDSNFFFEQPKDIIAETHLIFPNNSLIEQKRTDLLMNNDYNRELISKIEKGGIEIENSKDNTNFEENIYDIEGPLYNIENEVIDSLHDLEVKSDDLKESEGYLEDLQKKHSFNVENDFRSRFEGQLEKVMKKPDLKNFDKLLEVIIIYIFYF